MGRLNGKRVVVTGSSRGLGRGFAVEMAREGARVVLNGTNAEALADVEAEIASFGGESVTVSGSVADEAVAEALVARCVEQWGGIDLMVHNAGIVRDRTLLKMSVDEWDDVIAVHLRGAFLTTRAAARAMKDAGGGQIVLIISGSGLSGGFGQANYAAAKEGMMGLLRTCVLELTRAGIRTNAMWPVGDTDMTQVVFDRARASAEQEGRDAPHPSELGFGTPQEVAAGIVWLASDAASHLNGQCLSFNGRRAALWTHPEERFEMRSDDAISVEALETWGAECTPLEIHRPQLGPVKRS